MNLIKKAIGILQMNPMNSIRSRLVIYFSLLSLLTSASIGLISQHKASDALTKEAEEAITSQAVAGGELVLLDIKLHTNSIKMLSEFKEVKSMDWETQKKFLQDQQVNTEFLALAVVTPDGNAKYTDGTTAELGDRDYVQRALKGEHNVSNLILSKVTNEVVLMFAAPIFEEEKIVGALIGRASGEELSNITDDLGFGKSGYAFMIDSSGTIISHPNREMVLSQFNPIKNAEQDPSQKSAAALSEQILKQKQGVYDYSFNGKKLYAGFAPVAGTEWFLVITADEKEVLNAIPKIQKAILLNIFNAFIIGVVLVVFIGNSITKPIIVSVKHAKKVADLDITENLPPKYLKKKDEVGYLSNALQNIIINLRDIIEDTMASSEQVAAISEELTATSQQAASSAEEVSRTVEEIAHGASEQAKNTEEGSAKAMKLGEIIEVDLINMKQLNDSSNKVSEVVNEGLSDIEKLSQITKESDKATKEIYDVILKTNESSDKIGQASNVIASIAGQTNLLSLNASIEAARAGEHGKGFAVVADEIKKLAAQSASSTASIDEVVKELQGNVENAVLTMKRLIAISKEQSEHVKQNKEKYSFIAEAMKQTLLSVEQLNISSTEMGEAKENILDTMRSLTAIAEENAAGTQEASASMEEQTASMEEIASSSENLTELAQRMQSLINKFKL